MWWLYRHIQEKFPYTAELTSFLLLLLLQRICHETFIGTKWKICNARWRSACRNLNLSYSCTSLYLLLKILGDMLDDVGENGCEYVWNAKEIKKLYLYICISAFCDITKVDWALYLNVSCAHYAIIIWFHLKTGTLCPLKGCICEISFSFVTFTVPGCSGFIQHTKTTRLS